MTESYCLCCHKNMRREDYASLFFQNDVICRECRQKLDYFPIRMQIGELKVHSLYPYQDFTREMILQYKEGHDEALAPIFLYNHTARLNSMYHDYVMVEIPSSREKMEERGFQHVSLAFSLLNLEQIPLLEKKDNILQKYTVYEKRKDILSSFELTSSKQIESNILLVDDIVTSGNSLLSAYQLLKPYCSGKIQALTLSYNIRYLNSVQNIIHNLIFSIIFTNLINRSIILLLSIQQKV